jgi:hypothetical protein
MPSFGDVKAKEGAGIVDIKASMDEVLKALGKPSEEGTSTSFCYT